MEIARESESPSVRNTRRVAESVQGSGAPEGSPASTIEEAPSFVRRSSRMRIPLVFRMRGAILMLFAFYLVVGPAYQDADVVAAVTGYAILFMLTIFCILTIVLAHRFRNNLSARVIGDVGEDGLEELSAVYAGAEIPIVLQLSPCSIPPFMVLSVRAHFDHPLHPIIHHHLTGRGDESTSYLRRLVQLVTFPHRGEWRVKSLEFRLGDRFGCTSLRWELLPTTLPASVATFSVRPPKLDEVTLPVITSCSRPGDMVSHLFDPHGDPYDLRRYQPGDGLRRIVWKLYAKSGELVSRYPEASVTPEGQIVLFILAETTDDAVVSAAKRYAHNVEALDIEVVAGFQGGEAEPKEGAEGLEEGSIVSAWPSLEEETDATRSTAQEFLIHTRTVFSDAKVDRVILFASTAQVATERGRERAVAVAQVFEEANVEPVFFLVRGALSPVHSRNLRAAWLQRPLDMFLESDPADESGRDAPDAGLFHELCGGRGWAVHETEVFI